MILGGVNILGFYSTKANRNWDNTANREEYISLLYRGYIPSIQLFVNIAASASLQVYDEQLGTLGGAQAMTVTQVGSCAMLTFQTVQGQYSDDGYYSLVITTDQETIYSDVFGWTVTLTEFLKITATSGNVAINPDYKFTQDLTGFTYLVYVGAIENEIQPDTQEKGENLNGITEINYGSTSLIRSFDLLCSKSLYIFLNYLRMLSANGTVILEWKGESFYIKDIEIEKKEVHGGNDLYNTTLRFKKPYETMMIINAITE
jgi:hypothetical protein